MLFRRISILAATALLFCTIAVSVAKAQDGRTVNDFSLTSPTNATITLSSYASNKAVVVVFVNPNCAFSKLYQSRLSALNATYSGKGVQFLFINAPINLEATADAIDADKLKMKTTGTDDYPYLTDEGQKVSSLLGATKTPEVVILQPVEKGFAVRYKGAIDNNAQIEAYAKEHYVAQALDNILAGRPAGVADKRAAGCLIKKM
ncbi:alkyl hydroperoxide reductase/ Thiol specific antioxidant/ Mal allergen [Hymenobacter roseosalivarius DSM 11622]|uniref:Alkyl hydroperoxide reductase/ Thiol specific antioxidant/ Mal allergen n=1 Tax=Hymenobacter roseosalivarius DSM 11622 TaxID=645990 RepID=A0A1W1VUV4_9BACT|nr:redoxin domain-containing protein [Hymenobacter roseosalivarius]SMB97157.1 alkyl hydroperoxide reductase/ Thiol specific antioxidant/ Mal allergen [Hymenobacter roseosalivarius DSM 11622]